MKPLSCSTVRVEKIAFCQSTFSESELEEAAQVILELEGVITPPILLKTGMESYTVIDGEFEYHAALKAMALDLRKGKKINAYLVESEDEKAVYQKQIKIFRQRNAIAAPIMDKKEDRLASLENTVSQLLAKTNSLEKTMTDAVATLTNLITTQVTERTLPAAAPLIFEPHPSIDEEIKIIEDINTLSLQEMTFKFDRLEGVRRKTEVIALIDAERQKQAFLSRKEIKKRAKGTGLLGEATLNKIFSQWFF